MRFAGNNLVVIGQHFGAVIYDIVNDQVKNLQFSERLKQIEVSPDGKFLALAGETSTTIWEMTTLEAVSQVRAEEIRKMTFGGASGHELFISQDGGLVRLMWRPEELVAEGCRRFSNGDWQLGRIREIGLDSGHPCQDFSTTIVSGTLQ